MFNKILVAIDGSKFAQKGLESALEIAKYSEEAEIHLIQVVDNTVINPIVDLSHIHAANAMENEMLHILSDEADKSLEKVKEFVLETLPDVNVTTHLEFGRPAGCICACADEYDVDVVIIGSKGLRGVERLLMGSVAAEVITYTTKNVLVIK